MNKAGIAGIGCGMVIIWLVVIFGISGLIGMLCYPYTVNTWGEYAKGEDWDPITKKHGFVMGIIPVVGQACIGATIVTAVCDWIFIPDDPVKPKESSETNKPAGETKTGTVVEGGDKDGGES